MDVFSHNKQYKWKHPGNVRLTKQSFLQAPKERETRNKYNDKTNSTYETTNARAKMNCNRWTVLERSVEKWGGGGGWGGGEAGEWKGEGEGV